MAADARTPGRIRQDIEQERERLARAVEELRDEMGEATNVSAKLRANLPVVAVGALGAGFLFAGGIGATARLLFRRGREGDEKARFGRFAVIGRG